VQVVWGGQLTLVNQANMAFNATVVGGAGNWTELLPEPQVRLTLLRCVICFHCTGALHMRGLSVLSDRLFILLRVSLARGQGLTLLQTQLSFKQREPDAVLRAVHIRPSTAPRRPLAQGYRSCPLVESRAYLYRL